MLWVDFFQGPPEMEGFTGGLARVGEAKALKACAKVGCHVGRSAMALWGFDPDIREECEDFREVGISGNENSMNICTKWRFLARNMWTFWPTQSEDPIFGFASQTRDVIP